MRARLSDAVLPLIRTRADLHRWSVANAHGAQMHDAVAILEAAAETEDPTVVLAVTQQAIGSALKVVMRADDSSGIIGGACRLLLQLHPTVAARAHPPAGKLVEWMMTFQFDNECEFFHLDPVAYAPALGEVGMPSYRKRLAEVQARLGPRPPEERRWSSPHSRHWFTLDWNAQRLAVLDHDLEAIIRTHAKNRKVAAWLKDTAEAMAEIGQIDLAIDWAKRATDFDRGYQSQRGRRLNGARCSPSTHGTNCSKPASRCSDGGRHLPRLPTCIATPKTTGHAIATTSWKAWPALPGTRWCSRC